MSGRGSHSDGNDSFDQREPFPPSSVIDRLRAQILASGEGELPDRATIAWTDLVAASGLLQKATLSDEVVRLIAFMIPPTTPSAECLTRLEARRNLARAQLLEAARLEDHCEATSPGELLRSLRERATLTVEQTAELFGISPGIWSAIEEQQSPWFHLRAEALPAFARAIREPIDRLLALIALTARRAIYQEIRSRSAWALNRSDLASANHTASRDGLRMAFARVKATNEGAAAFLVRANQIANNELTRDESLGTRPKRPSNS